METVFKRATYPCTVCEAKDTEVIDSRLSPTLDFNGTQVSRRRRRRRCCNCGEKFTTYEIGAAFVRNMLRNELEGMKAKELIKDLLA